ncbi:MAG: tetratricopeptide repeat protein [Labilibaculum sp.]|nr:tetratricopeptide repeat protein [Labilibaculum sp.]MBI9059069.1 tetratricopeptide repeat protein [Labilibaculum sp.]
MKHIILLFLFCTGMCATQSFSQKTQKVDQLLFSGQYTEAIPLLEQMVQKNDMNSKLYFRLGKAYQFLNKNSLAKDNYQKAYKIDPNSTATLINLSGCLYALGNYPDAEKILIEAKSKSPNNYQIGMLLAKTFAIQNKHQKSLEIYLELNKQDSLNPYIFKQIGSLKKKKLDYIGSLAAYLKAHELNPKDLSVLTHIIQLYYEMTAYQQALAIANKGLDTYPDNSLLLKKKAQVLIGLEWYENALTILEDLKQNKQLSLAENKQLGICFMQTKQYKQAIESFSDCGQTFEKDPMINFYNGVCYARLEQHEKGIAYLENSIFYITPSIKAAMYLHLAKSYGTTRQFKKAIDNYKKHLELDDKDPNVYYEIATTYEEFGDNKDKALAYYTMFIQKSTDKDDDKYVYAKSRILHIKEKIHFQK